MKSFLKPPRGVFQGKKRASPSPESPLQSSIHQLWGQSCPPSWSQISAMLRGYLQGRPPPGCTLGHCGSPTPNQSSWSLWKWARGTRVLKSFQMIPMCSHSQKAQEWRVCRISESVLCPCQQLISGLGLKGLDAVLSLSGTSSGPISECAGFRRRPRGLAMA